MMEYEIAIRYRYYGDIIGNGEQNFDMETNEHTSTIPVEDLYGKGSAFTSAGPAPLVGDILEHPELVWTEDSWNEDKEERAKKRLGQQGAEISKYWVEKYKEKAGMYWHEFYKRNKDHFYKDRHYLHLVFPELIDNIGGSLNLLEVGCGVGNAFLPLLELNDNLNCTAIDFAQSAIDLLRENSLVLANSNRVHCVRCCIVEDELPLLDDSADLVLCMFVLSAIAPEKLQRVLEKIATKMKHGGKILVRDYGRFDEAQLRFGKGSKLEENFYVRQDGTCAYFFDLEELKKKCQAVGLTTVEANYIRRQYSNRQQKKARYRVWIHAKFVKQ